MSDCRYPDGAKTPGGGDRGYSGGAEGDDPTRESQTDFECAYGGDVPNGTEGTDSENWAD